MNIAIIPARGGSRRIPRKNIRLFHGRPIIAHSIDLARRSGLFQKIVVSTEDPEIVDIAKDLGAKIHHRSKALADDYTGTQDVMRAALTWWLSCCGGRVREPEHACCIYATAPLMTKRDLVVGLGMLASKISEYVYTVGPDGTDAGQFYWGETQAFVRGVPLQGHSQHLELQAERVCDINTEEDWLRAEQMYAALQAKEAA